MRATHNVVLVAVLVVAAGTGPAAAQDVTASVGAGAAVPLGYVNSGTNTGVHVLAAVSVAPASVPVSIRIDGMYSRFGLSGTPVALDGHFRVFQGTANVVYGFPAAAATAIRPYLIGGLGLYNYQVITNLPEGLRDDPNTDLGINGGAGVDVVAGALRVFAESRYHNVFAEGENVEFLPITVGIRLGRR